MTRRLRQIWFVLTLVTPCANAQSPIRYAIDLGDPARHLVQVTMEIPPGHDSQQLQLPVWNALYQIRDFSQYMHWIRAEDAEGHALSLTELNGSRWLLTDAEKGVRVRYQLFADSPDPYGAQLNRHHAFFNLAEILIYSEDLRNAAVQVRFRNVPAQWKIATSLEQNADVFTARNYDQLVDSPVEIGEFAEKDFSGPCGQYRVIFDDESAADLAHRQAVLQKLLPPIKRIVTAATEWMDDCPFQSYLFIYHSSDSSAGGGMEHSYSTAITLSPKAYGDDLSTFTSITAHEFFHLWNVKRIRPQSLEPVDYTRENYTRALWFSEGVDSTVGEYICLHAGLLDENAYLRHLSQQITNLESRPSHLTQSAEESSMDAWLEKYPHYRLPERSISYYDKGELLGVLLDLTIRQASNDRSSLRELFRWMNDDYAKQGKSFADSEGVREAAEAVSHADLGEFFRHYVEAVDEVPWDHFFAPVGLRVAKEEVVLPDPGFEATLNFDQRPTVANVVPGSNAERAGLKEGDIIVQINAETAGRSFERVLDRLAPGSALRLMVERDGVKRQLQWNVAGRPETIFQLEDLPQVTSEQKSRRRAWLFGDAEKSR